MLPKRPVPGRLRRPPPDPALTPGHLAPRSPTTAQSSTSTRTRQTPAKHTRDSNYLCAPPSLVARRFATGGKAAPRRAPWWPRRTGAIASGIPPATANFAKADDLQTPSGGARDRRCAREAGFSKASGLAKFRLLVRKKNATPGAARARCRGACCLDAGRGASRGPPQGAAGDARKPALGAKGVGQERILCSDHLDPARLPTTWGELSVPRAHIHVAFASAPSVWPLLTRLPSIQALVRTCPSSAAPSFWLRSDITGHCGIWSPISDPFLAWPTRQTWTP
jgi:hypothetical protein